MREITIDGGRAAGVVTERGRGPGRCRRAGGRRLVARDRRHSAGASARRCGRSRARCWRCRWTRRRRCCAMCCGCRAAIWCRACDGRLVIGATVEERGFDDAADRRRPAGADRGRLARRAGDRGIADRRDLGRVPPGLARRRADAGPERHRPAGRRDRPSPQRHSVDPGHRRRGQRLYTDRPAARDRPAVLARALRRLAAAIGAAAAHAGDAEA